MTWLQLVPARAPMMMEMTTMVIILANSYNS